MEPPERLLTSLIRALVENRILIRMGSRGLFVARSCASLVGYAVQALLELIISGGRRIINAVRERSPENNVMMVIFNEIRSMASESVETIINSVMAVIALLRQLLRVSGQVIERFAERGTNFAERLGERSLTFTSVSSVRRNQ